MQYCSVVGRFTGLCPNIILEVDAEDNLPLHLACRKGNKEVVEVLLQMEQSEKDIELIQLARFSLELKRRSAQSISTRYYCC